MIAGSHPEVRSMRFAVIGLGIGEVHAHVLSKMQDTELVGVCDVDPLRASRVASETGTQGFSSTEDLLQVAKPEAVCVCTPPKTHLPIGAALAGAGVHVLCEKPMAPSPAECQGLIDACKKAGVTLMIAQKKRFAPAIDFLKQHIGGDFGKPVSLNYRYHPGQVPKDWFWQEDDGGGPLVENSVHTFDTLRYLIGDIVAIQGIGGNLITPEYAPQIDIALGLLEFENGCIGAVELGTASEWNMADEEFFVACEKAVARSRGGFDRPDQIVYSYRGQAEINTFEADYSDGHRDFVAEIRHFIDCALTGATPLVSGEEGAKSVACSFALKEAVRTGKRVELPR